MAMKAVLALVSLVLVVLLAVTTLQAADEGDSKTVVFRFSHFEPGVITVPAGRPVTFVLKNQDPIAHEWIVGTEEVHERHRSGTEPNHDKIASEVSVPALASRETTLAFGEPGEYSFICHLPGHEAYGMRGTIRVISQ